MIDGTSRAHGIGGTLGVPRYLVYDRRAGKTWRVRKEYELAREAQQGVYVVRLIIMWIAPPLADDTPLDENRRESSFARSET